MSGVFIPAQLPRAAPQLQVSSGSSVGHAQSSPQGRGQPRTCRESSNKQERRHKQRAGLEGGSGFSASPPEVCLNPIKAVRDQPHHPEAMQLQTQQFKLQQESPSIFQANPCRDEHTAVQVMQKPSWRPVCLHQHLHPALCGSPKPHPAMSGISPCSSLPFACGHSQSGPLPTTNPAACQNSGMHGARAGG